MPLSIQLDFDSQTHLFKQLVSSIRNKIESGELAPGDKLPSTRLLAKTLKISRSTTSAAYNELHRLGLIENATHAGSFVARKIFAGAKTSANSCNHTDSGLLNFSPYDDCSEQPQFSTRRLPRHLLPTKKWTSLWLKHQHEERSDRCTEKCIEERLQRSLATYLERTHGVSTHPDQIVIFGNSHQALNAINSFFINQPTLYTTTSSQADPEFSLSPEKQLECLNYAKQQGTLIIEDDCDNQFVYGAGNNTTLKSKDPADLVIFLSTFSRILSPLTEIAFVVTPIEFVEGLTCVRAHAGSYALESEQAVLAVMLDQGHLERHVHSLRACFSARRRLLIEALGKNFGRTAYIHADGNGTTLRVQFSGINSKQNILEAALAAGLPARDDSSFLTGPEAPQNLLFSIPHLDEDTIAASIERFKNELNQFAGCIPPTSIVSIS